MMTSSTHGTKTLVSDRLQKYLQSEGDEVHEWTFHQDDLDRKIESEGLEISKVAIFRDLEMMLVVLNNKHVLNLPLYFYPFLMKATNEQLNDYEISPFGLHWPSLDADLSLRGLLLDEIKAKL